ncbi:MAG: rRNA maturation RNase YbeY [Solirubrobacteraceae bacterium]|nr:rRNA maturation RNase YbeY [Solirubrobacteraceae bacterium]
MSGLEVELVGPEAVPAAEVRRLVGLALARAGIEDGHVAVAFVEAGEIARLNAEHRGKPGPTDVLSFPVDETGPAAGPRELGDIVICPPHTEDLREAVVHGALHLVGYDHETDDGEMLAVQAEVLAEA